MTWGEMRSKTKHVLPINADHYEYGRGQVVAKGPQHHQHLAGDVVYFPLEIAHVCTIL